ncbi:hypothetical protein M408DRAFT_325838, partial [Serendipita vermifera MAFF 305830]
FFEAEEGPEGWLVPGPLAVDPVYKPINQPWCGAFTSRFTNLLLGPSIHWIQW